MEITPWIPSEECVGFISTWIDLEASTRDKPRAQYRLVCPVPAWKVLSYVTGPLVSGIVNALFSDMPKALAKSALDPKAQEEYARAVGTILYALSKMRCGASWSVDEADGKTKCSTYVLTVPFTHQARMQIRYLGTGFPRAWIWKSVALFLEKEGLIEIYRPADGMHITTMLVASGRFLDISSCTVEHVPLKLGYFHSPRKLSNKELREKIYPKKARLAA